jgi:hypothetical protein
MNDLPVAAGAAADAPWVFALPPEASLGAGAPDVKKGELAFALRSVGGVDGTRTRDPRRDRPVF